MREGPYLQTFARLARLGWDRWGTEADLRQIGPRRWRADSYPDPPAAADQ